MEAHALPDAIGCAAARAFARARNATRETHHEERSFKFSPNVLLYLRALYTQIVLFFF